MNLLLRNLHHLVERSHTFLTTIFAPAPDSFLCCYRGEQKDTDLASSHNFHLCKIQKDTNLKLTVQLISMAPSKANDSFDESPPPGLRRVSDGSIQQQSDEEEGDMHSMLCDLQLPKSSRNTNMEKRLLLLSVFVGLMIMGCLLRIWLYQEDDPVPLDIVTVSSDSPRVGLKNLPLRAHDVSYRSLRIHRR